LVEFGQQIGVDGRVALVLIFKNRNSLAQMVDFLQFVGEQFGFAGEVKA
jgi:hypothetical protein